MRKISEVVAWCVLVLNVARAQVEEHASRVVSIKQGPLRGFKASDGDYFVFYNIPYATAPTGKDKFKAPLPGPMWVTERQALDEHVACPQWDVRYGNMQEDCLIANVYVPNTNQTNLPVVVIIHGGAFQVGFGQLATPNSLVKSKKMVAVTFNYRLGIHGFLCLGTVDAPGNAGMKDQVALLRWVKENIAKFGGNPDDVTIDGFSAGGSSVELLMLSESANGLFHKAIPESGSSLSPWGFQVDPIESAKSYAEEFYDYKDSGDIYALEKLYKDLSYEELTAHFDFNRQQFYFVPCVERDIGEETFLTKAPYEILQEGKFNKVPMLYGFTDMEGLLRLHSFESWKDEMNKNFADFLPVDLEFQTNEDRQSVADKVKKFYFGDDDISENTIVGYVQYLGDTMFSIPILRSARIQVEAGNNDIYLYIYTYAEESLAKFLGINDSRLVGAGHCAQTLMVLESILMPNNIPENLYTEDFRRVKSTLMDIWTNFIITGKPIPLGCSLPEWPAAGAAGAPHMLMDRTLELRGPLLEDRVNFWLQLYDNYYRVPSPPILHPSS